MNNACTTNAINNQLNGSATEAANRNPADNIVGI